ALPLEPDLGEDEMAAVAQQLLRTERRQAVFPGRPGGRRGPAARARHGGALRAPAFPLRPSRDAGHDRHRVGGGERRLLALEVPHVLLVPVDVDVAPEPPALVEQVAAELIVARHQLAQRLAPVAASISTTLCCATYGRSGVGM